MPVIFSGNAGRVVALPDPAAIGLISGVQMEDWGGFPTLRAVITRILVSQQVNAQLAHMLGGLIYVYVFGDRMGEVQISGLAFDRDCGSAGGQPLGIQAVAAYYTQNRLAGRPTPLKVIIGTGPPMNCLLMRMSGDLVDSQSRVFQFNMTLALIPTVVQRDRRNRVQQGFGAQPTSGGPGPQPTTGVPFSSTAGNVQNFDFGTSPVSNVATTGNLSTAPTDFVNGSSSDMATNNPNGYVADPGGFGFPASNGATQDGTEIK